MNDLGLVSPHVWHTTLHSARFQRTAYLRGLVRRVTLLRISIGIVTLATLSLLIALAGRQDRHLEIVMAAISLASVISSIAVFAFSAV